LPALPLTEPALPDDEVLEEILPSLTERVPVAETSTLPALPLLPGLARLETLPLPRSSMLSALTLTEPALPAPKVSEEISPSVSIAILPALTLTEPAYRRKGYSKKCCRHR
jgi:hypothetical protein